MQQKPTMQIELGACLRGSWFLGSGDSGVFVDSDVLTFWLLLELESPQGLHICSHVCYHSRSFNGR